MKEKSDAEKPDSLAAGVRPKASFIGPHASEYNTGFERENRGTDAWSIITTSQKSSSDLTHPLADP